MIQDYVEKRKTKYNESDDSNEELDVEIKLKNELFLHKVAKMFLRVLEFNKHKKQERREIEPSFLVKILDFIDTPMIWLRKLTIPPINEDEYNHYFLIFWPILGIPFLVLNFFENYWFLLYSLPLMIVFIFFFYKF